MASKVKTMSNFLLDVTKGLREKYPKMKVEFVNFELSDEEHRRRIKQCLKRSGSPAVRFCGRH